MGKNGRKMYNFDDCAEFSVDVVETHMDDEKPIGTSHDVPGGDVVMQDATIGEAHGIPLVLDLVICPPS